MPAWIDSGFGDYARRMPRELGLKLIEVRPEPRRDVHPGARAIERLNEAEATRIRSAIPDGYFTVALDEHGHAWRTRDLANRLAGWRMDARDVAFVIGGADGLARSVKQEADLLWSLSSLTLPHGLVRVVVAEQLYRAHSVLKNHPYHRE